jgi:hypothetical protein
MPLNLMTSSADNIQYGVCLAPFMSRHFRARRSRAAVFCRRAPREHEGQPGILNRNVNEKRASRVDFVAFPDRSVHIKAALLTQLARIAPPARPGPGRIGFYGRQPMSEPTPNCRSTIPLEVN